MSKSYPQDTVDNTSTDKLDLAGLAPVQPGNIYEVFLAGKDSANADKALADFKERNKDILQEQKRLQDEAKVARRKHRYAALMLLVSKNAIHPTDSKQDNKVSLLPGLDAIGQIEPVYDKQAMFEWVKQNMPGLLTVDWKALDNILAKTDSLEAMPVSPPSSNIRKTRESLAKDWQTVYEQVEQIEFANADEAKEFLNKAIAFYNQDEDSTRSKLDELFPGLLAQIDKALNS